MTSAGMYGDYGAMRIAQQKLNDASEFLGNHLQDFHERAQLDSAIPSLSSNKTPVPTPSPLGPDLDQIETLIAQGVSASYKPVVDAVDNFLKETKDQLDKLHRGISDSIEEYRRRDEEAASGLPKVDPPR